MLPGLIPLLVAGSETPTPTPGPGDFTPLDLSAKLRAWWDVEDAAKRTLSGSDLTALANSASGGAALNRRSGGTNTYGAALANGRPGLWCDGMDLASGAPALIALPFEVWGTVYFGSNPMGGAQVLVPLFLAGGADSGGNGALYFVGMYGTSNFSAYMQSTTDITGPTGSSSYASAAHSFRAVFTSTGVSFAIDGGALSTTTLTPFIATTGQTAALGHYAGAFYLNDRYIASNSNTNAINNLAVTANTLTAGEIASMWAFMNGRKAP